MERLIDDTWIEDSISDEGASAYLSRCQVDTPKLLVRLVWMLVNRRRPNAGKVIDLGCGDARFASEGTYESYTGFEIDERRAPAKSGLGPTVRVECAFAARDTRARYSTCVGNPPYVRHHDLGIDWLERANTRLRAVDGYTPDGRSNAYVYFMWLALDCVEADGLVALVVPYEWVSRPASARLRRYVEDNHWSVDVYYLRDAQFERVLTTACVALIDKSPKKMGWHLHEISADGSELQRRTQLTRTTHRRLEYEQPETGTHAMRGLSPGGQGDFVLTEELRIRYRLVAGRDVLPAVTSFRQLTTSQSTLTERLFREEFVNNGKRCWLINPDATPHEALKAYLAKIPALTRENYTCSNRDVWWRFQLPGSADILYSSGFKNKAPKMLRNEIGAVHVGAVHGIFCKPKSLSASLLAMLREFDFASKVVPLSNAFLKIEVNQMNAVLNQLQARASAARA